MAEPGARVLIRDRAFGFSGAGGWRGTRASSGAARETLYQRTRTEVGAVRPPNVSAETPTMAQQQADALGLLAETALHHGIDPGGPGERYQVVVHVDAPVLEDADAPGQSALEDGTRVSAETSRRLACDASRVVMQHGRDGRVRGSTLRTFCCSVPTSWRGAATRRRGDCSTSE